MERACNGAIGLVQEHLTCVTLLQERSHGIEKINQIGGNISSM